MMHLFILSSDISQRLVVRGRIIDRVHTVVQATSLSSQFIENLGEHYQRRRDWIGEVFKSVSQIRTYPTDIPIQEALWQSLCFNGGHNDEPAPLEWGHSYKAWVSTFYVTVDHYS